MSDQQPIDEPRPYGRRAFVGIVAAGLSSLLWGDAAVRSISRLLTPVTSKLPEGLASALPSPESGWRIYSVNPPFPTFDEASWRLRIDGLVEQPMELTYAELRGLPVAEQVSDFHCVTGWSVRDVGWRGVRFADLLAQARPLPEAGALRFASTERPYVDSLTMRQAMVPDALLAFDMDGTPLKREHGAPVRVVMPRMYGYKSVKWVDRITVTRTAEDGYWEQRGYDRDAWIGRSNNYA